MPGGQAEDLEVDEHEATPSPAHRHQKGGEKAQILAAVDLRVLRDEAGEGGAADEGEEEGEGEAAEKVEMLIKGHRVIRYVM